MQLSATRIKNYLTCPRQFRYAYVQEMPLTLTGALAFGWVIHQTLNLLHLKSLQNSVGLDLEYAYQTFDCLWRQTLKRDRPLFKDGGLSVEQYWDLADDILRGYVEAHRDQPPPLALEFPFELPWREHALLGAIDRIDEGQNGLIVVDFKSGQRKPSPQDLQHDLQLTLYAWVAETLWGQRVERVVYYHLRDQTPLLTTRSYSDYRRLCDDILPQVVHGIQSGRFEPHYGFWCRWCDFRELCAAEGPEALP